MFTSELDDQLITIVGENIVLYDLSHKRYKDLIGQKKSMKKMATEL